MQMCYKDDTLTFHSIITLKYSIVIYGGTAAM